MDFGVYQNIWKNMKNYLEQWQLVVNERNVIAATLLKVQTNVEKQFVPVCAAAKSRASAHSSCH